MTASPLARTRELSWGGVALALLSCGPGEPPAPVPCPSDPDERLAVGSWDGTELDALPSELPMHYGPQGGQHAFVDLELETACPDTLTVFLDLEETASGRVVGLGEVRVRPEGCYALLEDVRVFLEDDLARTGRLSVYAEGDQDCALAAPEVTVNVIPPF